MGIPIHTENARCTLNGQKNVHLLSGAGAVRYEQELLFGVMFMIKVKQGSDGSRLITASVSDLRFNGYCEISIVHSLKGIKPAEDAGYD